MSDVGKAIGQLKARLGQLSPVPASHVTSLAVAVQARLPQDYEILLQRIGPVQLPTQPGIELYDPAAICAYVVSIYNMEGQPPHQWLALPIGRVGEHGDDAGYLRSGDAFGPELVLLAHEGPWVATSTEWHSPLASSLSALITTTLSK